MFRRIEEYRFVKEYTRESFETVIKEALEDGWELYGTFKFYRYRADVEIYFRELVKYESAIDESGNKI